MAPGLSSGWERQFPSLARELGEGGEWGAREGSSALGGKVSEIRGLSAPGGHPFALQVVVLELLIIGLLVSHNTIGSYFITLTQLTPTVVLITRK